MGRALLALVVLVSARLAGASELIAVPDRVDHVFDPTRGILYISTSSGKLQRYDVQQRLLPRPLRVGADLRGLDLTPDGAWLYVTEYVHGSDRGFVHKVSPDSGASARLSYVRSGNEGGSWDIAIGDSGLGLVTTDYDGSGIVPLRTLDLATDRLSERTDIDPPFYPLDERTWLTRSLDRSIIFLQESNSSLGAILAYDAASDSIIAQAETGMYLDDSLAAVSRDGSLIAMEMPEWVSVFDPYFHFVEVVNIASGGLLFDPIGDRLFITDADTDEIVAYDTRRWNPIRRWPVGEDVVAGWYFQYDGVMSATDDGRIVFLSTPSGVRAIFVGAPRAAERLHIGSTSDGVY